MNKPIKIFEAFSGYGSQSLSLTYQKIPHEVVGISEIDEKAWKAYRILHNPTINFGDISKIETKKIPSHDLFTYSFPCQSISIAGKQHSFEENSKTRSSLLWECKKIISYHKPQYLLMENVKNILSPKHKPYFDKWCKWLEDNGYQNYFKILNASDFGIPQNRERVFMVSLLKSKNHKEFVFPEKRIKKSSLIDILDKNVKQRYYVSDYLKNQYNENKKIKKENIIQLGNASVCQKSQAGRVISIDGIFPTLCAGTHGYANGYILNPKEGISSLRRLTPQECFRLMGLKEIDIEKIMKLNLSDTSLYKLAGNSICIPVLEAIFKNLLK